MIRMTGTGRERTVFVYEFVTGGGMAGSDLPGSWASEGHAMRRALAEDFAAVPGVRVIQMLDSRFPEEPGPWRTTRVTERDEERTFFRLAAEADDTLILAPETELFLLDRTEAVERLGGRLISCGSAAIRLAGNKYETARLLASRGIPTPPTFWRGEEDNLADDLRLHFHVPGEPAPAPGMVPFPAVLKSNDGAGSIDTFLVHNFDDLPAEADGDILQPFVGGDPRSASFLVGVDGQAHLVGHGRQRMELVENRFVYRGGVMPCFPTECDRVIRSAVELLEGRRGWIGIDYLFNEEDGTATVLEINPRVTTSYVGLRHLLPPGLLAAAWLQALEDPAAPLARSLASQVAQAPPIRFDTDGTIYPVQGNNAS